MGQADAKLLGRVAAHFAESARLKLQAAEALGAPVARAGALLAESLKNGGKALACGNGGPAPHAQPFPPQLVHPLATPPPPPARLALTTRSSNPTPNAHR